MSVIALTLLSVPAIISAAIPGASCSSSDTPQNFSDLVCFFVDIISSIIPIVAAIALLVFFWGLANFILKAGDEKGREEGKEIMKWGIVALFVMVSIWGIVIFLHGEFFNYSQRGIPQLPTTL